MNRIDQTFRLLSEEPTLFSRFQVARYMPKLNDCRGEHAEQLRESLDWLRQNHENDWNEYFFRVSYEL